MNVSHSSFSGEKYAGTWAGRRVLSLQGGDCPSVLEQLRHLWELPTTTSGILQVISMLHKNVIHMIYKILYDV